MESKWEYRENFHSTGCGDYDGNYEITDGKIFLCTVDDPEDITETENSLQQIARLLNESGCKFYSNNVMEHELHIESELAKMERDQYKEELASLRAKGDTLAMWLRRLRGSMMAHPDYNPGENAEFNDMVSGANQALAEWKGEKEVNNGCG